MKLTYIFIFLELKPAVSFQLYKVKKALFLIRGIRLTLKYRGKGSNLHTQRAPDPKSGVSTNSTTAAKIWSDKLQIFLNKKALHLQEKGFFNYSI